MKNNTVPLVLGILVCILVFSMEISYLNMIEKFLIFAFFIVIPLILRLVNDPNQMGLRKTVYHLLCWLQFPSAVSALSSLIVSNVINRTESILSGILSLGWLFFTCLLASYGLLLIFEKGFSHIEELAIGAGLMYFLVGGIWFSIYQFGLNVMGFGSTIISLTAIHFHFSSSVVPIFTGMLGRILKKKKWYPYMVGIDVTGPLIIAIGISFSKIVEFVGVILFVCNLTLYSIYTLFVLCRTLNDKISRLCITLSSLALLSTMALALWYGVGRTFGFYTISIPNMVLFHGTVNAFGFVLCGIVGWLFISPPSKSVIHRIPFSGIFGRFHIGKDFIATNNLEGEVSELPGLIDDFSLYQQDAFEKDQLDTDVRSFYERTSQFDLSADIQWKGVFRYLFYLYKPIAKKMGQINLPLHNVKGYRMSSKIISVQEQLDTRPQPRAWLRWEEGTNETIFVALYSSHEREGVVYNNIALPLLWGNMTGVLRPMNDLSSGLIFTSLSNPDTKGDEGIYYISNLLRVRLPLNEYFHIYKKEGKLLAKHYMWLFGVPLLEIDYRIIRKDPLQSVEEMVESNDFLLD